MKPVHFGAIVAVTAAVWSATIAVKGFPTSWSDAWWPFGSAVTVLGLCYLAFEKLIWRWPLLRGWFVETPDVSGTWNVTLLSSWKKNPEDPPLPPIQAFAQIRQTYRTLSVRLFTVESKSIATAWSFTKVDGVFEFATVYRNDPKIDLQDVRSRPHYGAFRIGAAGFYPASMDGTYWTDRKTNGSIVFSDRRSDAINSFTDGQELYIKAAEKKSRRSVG